MAQKFDAIIIGTGQAGPSLAVRITREGMRCAIIERKLFGGTCVNVGCIPTKTLVASARAAHMARRGADFGAAIEGPIAVDMRQVKARKDAVVRQSNEGVTNWLKTMDNLTVFEGHGRLARHEMGSESAAGDENLLQVLRIRCALKRAAESCQGDRVEAAGRFDSQLRQRTGSGSHECRDRE